MKKLFPYILILIVLAGIFNPTASVRADDPLGICTGISGLARHVKKSQCIIPPDKSFVLDQAPADPLGTCTGINETDNVSCDRKDLTREQCTTYTNNSNCRFIDWIENGKCEPPKTIMGGKCVTLTCTVPLVLKDGKCVAPPKTNDPLGTCTISVSEGPPNVITGQTKKQCDTAGGVWSADTNYHFLAPLPCENGTPGCVAGELETFDPTGDNKIGGYLNVMIRIFIGICAVLAVIMIVVGGIEYMTSELISNKENGKHRITGAIFGLVLALGAWTLLNTINPDLLKTDLTSLKNVEVTVIIDNFEISGALSRSPGAAPIKINFNKDAYPAAKAAGNSTGVDPALILAIFSQETGSGANTGGCLPANANMYPADLTALATIVGSDKVATTNVSCASGGGHGGAIGLMQFRPTTWIETIGTGRDPWKVTDALLAAGIFLKNKGAGGDANAQRNAACKYYSGVACQPGRTPPNAFYGDAVMAKMASIKLQITEAIKKGEISP